jgi:hypothetical protein
MADMAYAAIHKCGRIVAATVDSPGNKAKSRHVSGWIRRGEAVEHMEMEAVRKGDWCECYRKQPAH